MEVTNVKALLEERGRKGKKINGEREREGGWRKRKYENSKKQTQEIISKEFQCKDQNRCTQISKKNLDFC